MSIRVGVVLSGCGVYDGSEIHEAVSLLIALDRHGAGVTFLAPNVPQVEVVNHLTHKPQSGEQRGVLVESARIARGKVQDIARASPDELDALVFPGGFGAAKNLSNFASAGHKCDVQPDVARLMKAMHAAGKPIGLACISPVLAAAVFGKDLNLKPKLTIGKDPGTAAAINAMGGEHHNVGPAAVHVDERNRLVTTPCYMNDVGPWTVYQGAEKLVEEVLRLTGKTSSASRGHAREPAPLGA
jgi:enhancing lycopene biosynthesis protein 2